MRSKFLNYKLSKSNLNQKLKEFPIFVRNMLSAKSPIEAKRWFLIAHRALLVTYWHSLASTSTFGHSDDLLERFFFEPMEYKDPLENPLQPQLPDPSFDFSEVLSYE